VLTIGTQTGVDAALSALVEQVYRRARAQYGDARRRDASH
jgi:hypothetical protein